MYNTRYLCIAAGFLLSSGSIFAQQKKDSIHNIKGVVIDYLSKEQQVKRTNSQNIEIVSQDQIQKNLGGSLSQSLERIPGINAFSIGSGQSKPIIRGLGFNRVVVTEQGIKHESQQWGTDHGLEIDQYAVGEVKLVKGPAALMVGSDAIGGLLAIERPEIPARDTLTASAILTAKSVNDLLGGSFSVMKKKNHFYFDSRVTYLDYGDFKIPSDHVSIYSYDAPLHKNRMRNTAGQELNFHLSAGYVDDKFSSIFYLSNLNTKSGLFANAHGLEPRNVDTEMYDRSSRDIDMPSQKVNHIKLINRTVFKYGNQNKLTIESAFQNNYREEFSFYITHGYMPPNYPSDLDIPRDLERLYNKSVYSMNVKNDYFFGNHQLTAGINSEFQDNKIGGWSFLIPSYTQQTLGGFIYDKFKVNQRLILNAGLRFDYGKIETGEHYDWFVSPLETGPEYVQRSQKLEKNYSQLTWGAGANYNLNSVHFRLNVGKSFRMPIPKEIASNGVNYHYYSFEKGNPNLNPEESYQVDLGIEYKKDRLHIDFNPYYQYFPNYIYLNPTSKFDYLYGAGNQVYEYSQSKVLRYGAEIKLAYRFTDFLDSEILGEYLYSEQLSGQKKGYNLPFAPAPSALFNLTYRPKISNTLQNNYLSLDFKMGATQDRIVPPERVTQGYKVFNLSLGTDLKFKNRKVNIYFQVQNLLNEKYFMHTNFYRLIGVPEAGRNFVLSVKIPII